VDSVKEKKTTSLGIASGAVAGLVAITPASGYVGPLGAIAIGLAGGVICAFAVSLKFRLGYDDSLDVVGVHMIGGLVGALLTGVFADQAINEFGADGLLFGGGLTLLGKQLVAIGATLVFSLIVTMLIVKLVDAVIGMRVAEEEEISGLDLTQHAEVGYAFNEGGGASTMAPAPPAPVHATSASAVRVPQGGEA
jgi:Amt family ammonium transporter